MNKSAIILAFCAAVVGVSCKKSSNSTPAVNPVTTYQYSFDDEMNADTNSWSYTDSLHKASVSLSNGYLKYIYHPTPGIFNVRAIDFGLNTTGNFVLQCSVQSDNAMGLLFGASANNYGYSLEVDNNGKYALFVNGDSVHARTTILNWAFTSAAKPGFANKLELDRTGDVWYGFINGIQVFTVTARPLTGTKVGFITEANTNGTADYLIAKWN